jgi:hypothetical protein
MIIYEKELIRYLACRQQWTDRHDAAVQNKARRKFELLQHGEEFSITNCSVGSEQFGSPNFRLKQVHFLSTTVTQLPVDIQYAQIKGHCSSL